MEAKALSRSSTDTKSSSFASSPSSHTTDSTCPVSDPVAGQPHSIRQGQQKTTTATSIKAPRILQGKHSTSEMMPILPAR